MSSQTPNGRITSKNAGFGAVFTALAAISLLAVTAGSALAQSIAEAQADINAALSVLEPGKTLATAKTADIAAAVNEALVSDTDPLLAPSYFAEAAITPVAPATVPTKSQLAAVTTIVAGVVDLVVTGSAATSSGTTPLATDLANVTDGLLDVGGTTTAALTLASKEAVVKTALLTISNLAVITGSTSLFAADTTIGTALANDTILQSEALSKKNPNGLVGLLEAVISSVSGAKSKTVSATTLAANIPAAAEAFVQGVVNSGIIPDSTSTTPITLDELAVDLMAPLSKNATADEDIAVALGSGTSVAYSGTANLEGEAQALFKSFPKEVSKITQGLISNVTPVNVTEASRVSVINNIVTTTPGDAVAIAEGATYLDPFFASEFTTGVLDALVAESPAAHPDSLAIKDAPGIAAGLGNILGQDAAELADVSGTFAAFISDGVLPSASAGTYATDLIASAVATKVPVFAITTQTPSGGGGGKLILTTGTGDLVDLESIGDQLAVAIVDKEGPDIATKAGATAVAGDIGALAKDIAKYLKANTSTLTDGQFVADALAGSLLETIADLVAGDSNLTTPIIFSKKLTEDAESLIFTDVLADVEAESSKAVALQIKTLSLSGTNSYASDPGEVGPIAVQETAITNL